MKTDITIRRAGQKDIPTLVALGEQADMGTMEGFDTTLVAECDGRIAGFSRIRTFGGQAYVNPIVVNPDFQGRGVGELLMRASLQEFGPLELVARGSAVPFYRKLGGYEIPWEGLAPEISCDCDECPTRAECNPLPMRIDVAMR